jgi:hypothetical protein
LGFSLSESLSRLFSPGTQRQQLLKKSEYSIDKAALKIETSFSERNTYPASKRQQDEQRLQEKLSP